MDHHSFLRSRRSVRRFTQEEIPDAAVERMLTTAMHAPSAHNRQPWRFCVLKRSEAKARLADAMATDFQRDLERDSLPADEISARLEQSRSRITSSPLVIILCLDMSEMDEYPDTRRREAERMMGIQSTAAAGLQLLLAAHAEGLSAVWTCGPLFAPDTVRRTLGLPDPWEPQAMFFIGHPDQKPREKALKPIMDVVRFIES
jgi:coenzyme F420-0:L-glutamate ligase / coenzyme F420-1:gamma-L-glutamate ligase